LEHADAGIACMQTVAETSGTMEGICEVGIAETCSDGTTYGVKCSCPAATCFCTESSANSGGSGGPVPFAAGCVVHCAAASIPIAYEACGFPLPQR
jgi:hypothetical protein